MSRELTARRARASPGQMAERDAALGQVVGRQLQRDLVTRQNADVVLAHLAAGVGNQLMAVFQRDAKARVGQDFRHGALHFNQFFFGHVLSFLNKYSVIGA